MLKEAIILAGGLGTRLQSVVSDVPKPMAPVNGKPFLEYLLNYLKESGVERIILSVGYKWETIKSYFGNNFNGIELDYAVEEEPLGTGGGIKLALSKCRQNQVLILNGDTFLKLDLKDFYHFHKDKQAEVSLCLRKLDNTSRYGTVKLDKESRIKSFEEKSGKAMEGVINGGVYIFNKEVIDAFPKQPKFSLEKDFFEPKLESLKMYGFVSSGYFIDIGIPEDYQKAQDDFKRFEYK